MRMLFGAGVTAVFALIGSQALATDPPASTSKQATSTSATTPSPATSTSSAATPAATTAAGSKSTADATQVKLTAADDEAAAQRKRFKAAGYKPEIHDGNVVFCSKETIMGSRFDKKVCTTAHLLEE